MSRPSFIGILLLTVGLAILAGLALWHHQWLVDLENQLTRHRLQLKVLTSKEPPPAADVTAVQTLPEVKPAPSGAERLSGNVPARPPAIQQEAALALTARSPVIEPVDEFAGMDNRAIDKECDRRGLLTDTLPERWRCTNGRGK